MIFLEEIAGVYKLEHHRDTTRSANRAFPIVEEPRYKSSFCCGSYVGNGPHGVQVAVSIELSQIVKVRLPFRL